MLIRNPHLFLLMATFSLACKSSQQLEHVPQRWISRPGNVKMIPSSDSGSILYAVKPMQTTDGFIDYTDLSLRNVVFQIAAAYKIGYVKFMRPIEIKKIGALGGGRSGTDSKLATLLDQLSKESTYYLYADQDSIVVKFHQGLLL